MYLCEETPRRVWGSSIRTDWELQRAPVELIRDDQIGEGFQHLYIVVFEYLAKSGVEVVEELGTAYTVMTSVDLRGSSSIHTVECKELGWLVSMESGDV